MKPDRALAILALQVNTPVLTYITSQCGVLVLLEDNALYLVSEWKTVIITKIDGIEGIPLSIYIDEDGVIIYSKVGLYSYQPERGVTLIMYDDEFVPDDGLLVHRSLFDNSSTVVMVRPTSVEYLLLNSNDNSDLPVSTPLASSINKISLPTPHNGVFKDISGRFFLLLNTIYEVTKYGVITLFTKEQLAARVFASPLDLQSVGFTDKYGECIISIRNGGSSTIFKFV
jgi:hypothetical protein